jgi:hypothetical protein
MQIQITLPRERCTETTRQLTKQTYIEMTTQKSAKCTLQCKKTLFQMDEEIVYTNDNHVEFSLIWHGDVDDEEEFETNIKSQLRAVINYFKRFKSLDNCFNFISSIHIEEVFAISANCTGTEVEKILHILHDVEQIIYIYIYSQRKTEIKENTWTESRKLQEGFTNIEHLIRRLMEDVKSIHILLINILKIDGDERSLKDSTQESIMLLRSKLFIVLTYM